MKTLYVLFCLSLVLLSQQTLARYVDNSNHLHKRTYNIKNKELSLREQDQEKKYKQRDSQIKLVQKVKLHIINGNLSLAKLLLKEATISVDFTKSIQLRYLIMIYFIEGQYSRVIELTKAPEMKNFSAYTRICTMEITSLVILNQVKNLQKKWKKCRDSIISKSPSALSWLETIITLKLSKNPNKITDIFKGVAIDNNFDDELRIYLKMALYLNQQHKIIPRFKYFGLEQIKDPRTRELIGLNHFRHGNLVEAYQFLEDLETVNAEIFKGNLYLHQNKYELAYAQYKLALKQKGNSQNALERILPISWQLQQWDQGYVYASNIHSTKNHFIESMTLKAAFLTMSDEKKEAQRVLKQITDITHSANPVEVSQIYAFNAVLHKDYTGAQSYSSQSCYANDALNCWLSLQLNTWEDLNSIMEKEGKIHDQVEDLVTKYSKGPINEPIEDNKYIDQERIEELDNNLINLAPVN